MTDINGNPIRSDEPADTDEQVDTSADAERPADLPPGQAKPGPHPHEAADIRYQAGLVGQRQDPMEGFRDEAEQ